jgi:hypothetical protein
MLGCFLKNVSKHTQTTSMSSSRAAVHCQNVHSVAVDGNLDRAVQRRVENCSETVSPTLLGFVTKHWSVFLRMGKYK